MNIIIEPDARNYIIKRIRIAPSPLKLLSGPAAAEGAGALVTP